MGRKMSDREEANGEEVFYVEDIVGKKINEEGVVRYCVKWQGYSKLNTWEPLENVEHCENLVRKANQKYAEKDRKRNILKLSAAAGKRARPADSAAAPFQNQKANKAPAASSGDSDGKGKTTAESYSTSTRRRRSSERDVDSPLLLQFIANMGGSMFRLQSWDQEEIPLCILFRMRIALIDMLVVRLMPATAEEQREVEKEPEKNAGVGNTVIVPFEIYFRTFPDGVNSHQSTPARNNNAQSVAESESAGYILQQLYEFLPKIKSSMFRLQKWDQSEEPLTPIYNMQIEHLDFDVYRLKATHGEVVEMEEDDPREGAAPGNTVIARVPLFNKTFPDFGEDIEVHLVVFNRCADLKLNYTD